jgi:hypothetical protein
MNEEPLNLFEWQCIFGAVLVIKGFNLTWFEITAAGVPRYGERLPEQTCRECGAKTTACHTSGLCTPCNYAAAEEENERDTERVGERIEDARRLRSYNAEE